LAALGSSWFIDPIVLIGVGSNSNDINARPAVARLTVVDLDAKLRPVAEAVLTEGEERGVCVATQVGMFKGRQVLLGVTDGRLLVQGMNRKFEPCGAAISLPPERIADASAEGAGGGWVNVGLAIMDGAAVTLKVRITDGEKLKLTMIPPYSIRLYSAVLGRPSAVVEKRHLARLVWLQGERGTPQAATRAPRPRFACGAARRCGVISI
jgi:hypothetical protein